MNNKRITPIKVKQSDENKSYILYWMQQAQRVQYNHALEHAIQTANRKGLPLVVYFGLTDRFPEANERHYAFMLEGLSEVERLLKKLKIAFVVKKGSPEKAIRPLLEKSEALIMDEGYLTVPRSWRKDVCQYVFDQDFDMAVDVIDTDLIVPVKVASNKAEYGAYTIRPKIKKIYQNYRDFSHLSVYRGTRYQGISSDFDLSDPDRTLAQLDLDRSVKRSIHFKGGYIEASRRIAHFLENKVNRYQDSNDPGLDLTSKLSPYLHFGQISALDILERIFLALEQQHIDGAGVDGFIEQLLIRRELAFNYVYYHKGYDRFATMTEPWAYRTMEEHEGDARPTLYRLKEIERGETDDPYFNAAMKEMRETGYMHNYMRMYWAKKIMEWTQDYKTAYERIMMLNNTYFIDGRDPNSYAGVAWCFGKHDRAWIERAIFGKLRYMNANGLKRKFAIDDYVSRMDRLPEKDMS
jgi:deoxyribodipyrimidine photo-lyase